MENMALLLSMGYEPIKVISWQRAITLMLGEKVEVLEVYDRQIHSPSLTLNIPAVVRLNRKVKRRPQRVKFSRHNLFFRDNYTCQYCHHTFPSHQLTCDHIIPKSQGGLTSWTNVVTSCSACNRKKGNKPLQAVNFKLLRLPMEPSWLPTLHLALQMERAPGLWRSYLHSG